nr:MAG TPA: hypothetical protein [Bacteriophage sp.]
MSNKAATYEWLSNELFVPMKNLFLFDDYGEAVKWILEKCHWGKYYPVVVEETFWYKFDFNVKYYCMKREDGIYLGGYPGYADTIICSGGRNQLGDVVNYENDINKIIDLTFSFSVLIR